MDEPGVGLEGGGRGFGMGEAGREAVALEATMNGAARQAGVDAAAHGLGDVVDRQGQAAAQFNDQGLFPFVMVVASRCNASMTPPAPSTIKAEPR